MATMQRLQSSWIAPPTTSRHHSWRVPRSPSSASFASSLGICSATRRERPASPASGKEAEDGKGRSSRGKRSDLMEEEDIYTIDDGWKVDFAATEEMLEVGGVQIPVRLKQQLQEERRMRQVMEKKAQPEPPRATHRMLRVMAGKSAGKKLVSPADAQVRPMMEVVRGAVFNILKSLAGWSTSQPTGRWLDLYSGTGSVAIEALSRGCCAEAHFVEMDPWVISKVLLPNLVETNFQSQAMVHTSRVETFLKMASDRGAKTFGGAFDFISVTPPYEAVSYTELMTQLAQSPLLSESAFMVVEYPIKSKHEMPDSCGVLSKIKDRRYGRTHVAIYGPKWFERDDEVILNG